MIDLKEYIRESLLDDEDDLIDRLDKVVLIKDWLKKYNIINYKINDDYTIDVNGDVGLVEYPEKELPEYINFNKINGDFSIICGKFENLRGFPKEISSCFYCSHCDELISFENGPKKTEVLYCNNCNKLTSLEYCPDCKFLDCSFCKNLASLEGCPETLINFVCINNFSITSLKGGPKKILNIFSVENCKNLKSLKYSPRTVGGRFDASYCDSLESLEGGPKIVKNDYWLTGCKNLKSFEHLPKKIDTLYRPKHLSKEDALRYSNVKKFL